VNFIWNCWTVISRYWWRGRRMKMTWVRRNWKKSKRRSWSRGSIL